MIFDFLSVISILVLLLAGADLQKIVVVLLVILIARFLWERRKS